VITRTASTRGVIEVPASIGNLGPGFDTLGLAVSLYLRVTIRRKIDDGQGRLVTHFAQDRPVAQNGIARAFAAWPFRTARPPSLEVDVDSEIPERAGLGSSAAAAIAGLRLRERCDGRRTVAEMVAEAARLEGHPDNAGAVLFGGLTSSRRGDDGSVTVARWPWPARWTLVIATPHVQLATSDSRRVIPASIPLPDVIFNLQRLALLLHAVHTRNAGEFTAALEDRCHQPYREPLVPVFGRALALQHPDVLGVCLSGAGPSVVAIARRNPASVERALQALYRSEGVPCTVRTRRVHQ
jgi:homoserine kinase